MAEEELQLSALRWAALASISAGVIHGGAVGLHVDDPFLSRIFLLFTIAQVVWGIGAMTLSNASFISLGIAINGAAVGGWALTRTVGISFVPGLELAERAQIADSLCAILGAIAVLVAGLVLFQKNTPSVKIQSSFSAFVFVGLTVVAMLSLTGHEHEHLTIDDTTVDGGLVVDANGVIISATSTTATLTTEDSITTPETVVSTTTSTIQIPTTAPLKIDTTTTAVKTQIQTSNQSLAAASGWPRAWDPANGEDFSGIAGATAEQKARAVALIANNARDLAKYSNVSAAIADGYVSIGDKASGFEHFIKYSLLNDGRVLDTTAPESLVYQVGAGVKTLVSTMYIANPNTAINDVTLVNYAGGLMQWHVHINLCWALVSGVPRVVGVTDVAGNCPAGSVHQSGGAPMVHVWITPNPCGPFAALEGTGAGVADLPDDQRVDKCNAHH